MSHGVVVVRWADRADWLQVRNNRQGPREGETEAPGKCPWGSGLYRCRGNSVMSQEVSLAV